MVVSWATGVQNDVEMQMANATMKGFGSAWPSRARFAGWRRAQARSVLKSRRWSCARHRDVQLEIATDGSIDFHGAMPENRGVAAGVAVAIAAAKNEIGRVV
jgi:hypothetical protein